MGANERACIVDLHKRIFFEAGFGCFFVIKIRFERNDKFNNPDRCYVLARKVIPVGTKCECMA